MPNAWCRFTFIYFQLDFLCMLLFMKFHSFFFLFCLFLLASFPALNGFHKPVIRFRFPSIIKSVTGRVLIPAQDCLSLAFSKLRPLTDSFKQQQICQFPIMLVDSALSPPGSWKHDFVPMGNFFVLPNMNIISHNI